MQRIFTNIGWYILDEILDDIMDQILGDILNDILDNILEISAIYTFKNKLANIEAKN